MKKLFVLMMTLSLVVVFGTTAFAIDADWADADGSLTIEMDSVIFMSIGPNFKDTTVRGFRNKGEIEDAKIIWPDIHRLNVDSAVDYVLACNIYTGGSTFDGSTFGDFTNTLNSAQDKVWDGRSTVSEGIFKNFTYAQVSSTSSLTAGAGGLGWRQVDTVGSYNEPPNGNTPKYQALAHGNHTFNTTGDDYFIDYMWDFTSITQSDDFEVPSGTYEIAVNYMVAEE